VVRYRSPQVLDFGLPILQLSEDAEFSILREAQRELDKIKSARGGEFPSVSSLAPTLTLAGISNIFKKNLAFTGA
jgi:hypothetical protein